MRGSKPHAAPEYGVRNRIRRLGSAPLVAAAAGLLCLGGGLSLWALPGEASAQGNVECTVSGTTQQCTAGGIDGATSQDDCPGVDGAGAYFVINQLDSSADAPQNITVTFTNGSTAVYQLLGVEGNGQSSTAKYDGPAPSRVAGATVTIYAAWDGEFVLSHYCGTIPTGPTSTTSSTTSTSTSTTTSTTTTTLPDHSPSSTSTTTTPHGVSPASGTTTTTTTTKDASTTPGAAGGDATTTTSTPAAASGALAFTGDSTLRLAIIGGLMVLGGTLLVFAIRRRHVPMRR